MISFQRRRAKDPVSILIVKLQKVAGVLENISFRDFFLHPGYLGPKGPVGDNYLYAHLQVDAQASYRVQRTLTVLWQGLNLTDMVFGFYNGSPWYVTQREYYRPTYSFGLRWEPHRE